MEYDQIPATGKGTDVREAGPMFMMVEHGVLDDYPDLTPHQFIVYCALLAYTNSESRCVPSIAALARRAHVGTTAVKEALNNLVERELVRKIPRLDEAGDPTSNLYVVYRPSALKLERGVGRQTTDPRRQTTQGGSPNDPGWVAKRPQSISTEVEPPNQIQPYSPWNASARFQEFWNLYPRKVAKPNAQKAFNRLITPDNFGDLIAGVTAWAESIDWMRDGGQFIPHPTTFLNREQWNDEPSKPSEAKPNLRLVEGVAGVTRSYTRDELRDMFQAEGRGS